MTARRRLFKLLTSALVVLWLAALAGIVVYRQWQRRALVAEAPVEGSPTPRTEQPVRVQKGFVFTYALGVAPSFRVAAKESVEFASGWLELKQVEITFFQEGQVAYGLLAETARLSRGRNEAVVEGDPQLTLGAGVVARASRFTLTGVERRLQSAGTVSFAGRGWGGVAGSLSSSLTEDLVTLADGVSVVAEGAGGRSWTLLAKSARYRRKEGLLEFPEGLLLVSGGLQMHAPGGSVRFDQENQAIEKLTLAGVVELSGRNDAGEQVEGVFGDAEAVRQPDGSYLFQAAAAVEGGWARVRVTAPGGEVQELAAWNIAGLVQKAGLEWFEGQGLVCAATMASREEPAWLWAKWLRVTFLQGQPAQAAARGEVHLQQGEAVAWGDELSATLPRGPGELWATGSGQVRFATAALEGACQRIAFGPTGEFVASGGVQGKVQPSEEKSTTSRFAARAASGRLRQGVVTLEGEARIWEGERVIKAERILLDRQQELLKAFGGVVTQAPGEGGALRTIAAEQLVYDRRRQEATYTGGVKLQDQQGVLASSSLVAYLAEDGGLLRGEFLGEVAAVDRAGRRLSGEAATFDGPTETLTVRGGPAVIEEPSGNQVQAATVDWHRRTGSLEVRGEVESPSRTVYHPEGPGKLPARRTPSPRK